MLNGIEESKLSKTRHIRVQSIPGGKIDDIKENLNDLLHEELQKVIIHVGTNNAMTDTPKEIFEQLISLKHQIESILPKCEVTISNLIMRTDEPKASKINEEVNSFKKSASINFVENSNIKGKQLGKRGLHLNIQGNKMFARNLLNAIRNWYNVGSSDLVFNYVDTDLKNVNIINSNKNSTNRGESENIGEISNSLSNDISSLINLRKDFSKNPILSYLNINSLGGKFDNLWEFCFKTEVDILCIDETKINPSYPDSQFHIDGYQFPPFRKDRNKHGGGKIVYVRNGIIAKRIKQFEEGFGETICLEFTLSKKKWCVLFVYRPPQNNNKASFFNEISITLNQITNKYENFIIMGDLNIDTADKTKDTCNYLSDLCDTFSLANIIKGKTCFKAQKGTSIDVLLTNRPRSFHKTGIFETGFSDHRKLILSVFHSYFIRIPPKTTETEKTKVLPWQKNLARL